MSAAGPSFVMHYHVEGSGQIRVALRGPLQAQNIVSSGGAPYSAHPYPNQPDIDSNGASPMPWPTGEWHHTAFTYDENANGGAGEFAMYFDGVKIRSGPPNGMTAGIPTGPIDMGTWGLRAMNDYYDGLGIGAVMDTGLRRLHGLMDEFYLFTRALTPAEINLLAHPELVPEPASFGLLLVGCSLFAAMRRRERHSLLHANPAILVVILGLISAAPAGANPIAILNGDFQTGVLAPSTTAYAQSATMTPPATWNIVSFNTLHPSWADFFDHTHGDANGHFTVVNGTDAGLGPAWAQTIAVTPGMQYELSAWFATLFAAARASLEFRVMDGATPVATSAFSAPVSLGVWEQRATTFSSGGATSLSIQIWDTNLSFGGNDYAIDDISFSVVIPEPGAPWLFAAGSIALVCSLARRR
jgi:hypothetical protein